MFESKWTLNSSKFLKIINGKEIIADALTKPLRNGKFERHVPYILGEKRKRESDNSSQGGHQYLYLLYMSYLFVFTYPPTACISVLWEINFLGKGNLHGSFTICKLYCILHNTHIHSADFGHIEFAPDTSNSILFQHST